ncbi:cAMP-regulated phosphoprotein 21-like [Actinia tenebrosa]|uniref:cAMP-regulated phosphoprotein 21-like n=1 Tax=Actinia tenebrosa TaxID=6105 RepID=A0A6P8J2X5_ACTTE|nr:cAMP-regulated phosphoprotein 21-like [Actinia tenebrosa]XP_031573980.1 cAMP-regulated phosphoprotein 21-like [Actinia tenebrosa]XP_031573982.1 cAMP-regulated phosphoprotein 21-like [Actinia tenebrosa]XP_031573983.1 cAMP-regulated phosphoprotein 21-like [Actinia tenebrosa]XP_031573984.1 cAMP-regulated phosphoprotein 21-like [Actinia tenebrosa]
MDKGLSQDSSSQDMTKLQNNHSPDNSSIATVTTAEVSSAETTESPRQQPQAVTMATDIPSVSYSTVHVQQSQAISGMRTLLLPKAASEPSPHNPRKTLVRSAAVRSTPSPPLPNEEATEAPTPQTVTNTSFDSYIYQSSDNEVLRETTMSRQESLGRTSKQGSFSRDNSFEYTDSTGTDLHEFIVKTLRNPRDRKFVLKLEHDFLNFIQDPMIIFIKYPPMTSYYRMIVHRVAAFFGMEHNVDQQTGKSVIINRSINTRIPEQRFADLVSLSREESEDSEGSMPRAILRRQNTPSGESTPPKVDSPSNTSLGMEDKRSKSIEQRVEEYHKARERIFNQDSFSSQSSQSSKGDPSDMPQTQILTRDDPDIITQELPREQVVRKYKSQSFDNERTMDKRASSASGIRIMSNKMMTRSYSSPGASATAFAAAEHMSKGSGSPKGSRLPLTSYTMPVSGVQYWTPEGVPFVPVQGGEVQMVQTQGMPAGMQGGMVPVMTAGGPSQGNVMWSVPSDSLQQGMMLINPNAAVGPDGNPMFIVQSPYQPMVMKSGNNPGYAQQPQQHRQQQQPMPQGATMSPQGGQVVVPQYVGGVQPSMYMVQQPNRSHYGQQQGTDSPTQSQWTVSAQPMTSPSYRDLSNQFTNMSVSGQPQEVDQTMQQGMIGGGDSGVVASSTTTPPLYVASVSQASGSGQAGQVQYMMMPPQGMHPHQPLHSMVGQPVHSHMVPQAMQQGTSSQQNQAFVVTAQTPYSPSTYQPTYGFSKDGTILQHQRSQSPPTPPQTSSPVLATPYNQSIAANSLSNQQVQNTQYHNTSHSQSQVLRPMVPVVVAGAHPVQVGAPVIPGNQPGQMQAQGGTIHYPQHVVQVPAPFHPPGQNRMYNLDRRTQKSSDLYTAESAMMAGQGGSAMGQVAVTQYGEPMGMVAGERGHYTQYYQAQRFNPTQGGSIQGAQHQQYSKHKSKQYHKKKDSPREQSSLKRQGSKSSDTENSSGGGTVLEIYNMIGGVKDHEADIFDELISKGARIKRPSDNSPSSGETLRAVFTSAADAEQALAQINSPNFKLRLPGSSSTTDNNSQVQSNP